MNSFHDVFYQNFVLATIENAITKKNFNLNLSNSYINELPKILAYCVNLSKLYLHQNSIKSIHRLTVNTLRNLRNLSLNNNCLTVFPIAICELPHLAYVNLSNNNIKSISSEIGNLTELTCFWCNGNSLETIADELCNCRMLDTFGARNNQLIELPIRFGKLKALRWCTLENNKLKQLPSTFSKLKNLIHLNLNYNCLKHFPEDLMKMSSIKYCYLKNNQIDNIAVQHIVQTHFMNILNLNNNSFVVDDLNFNLMAFHHVVYDCGKTFEEIDNNNNNNESDDWEHSVATSQLNTSDDSGYDNDLERYPIFLPELATFVTAFN